MTVFLRRLLGLTLVIALGVCLAACGGIAPKSGNAKANAPIKSETLGRIAAIGSTPGAAMMIRIFKEESKLEVWKQNSAGAFKLLSSYEICAWSGTLGPKIKEGDRQSPEGFYTITPALLNPNSSYYLAFNTGFPNKFDRAWGRTGSDLMVHGDCSSRGCYSMTDASIAEIYALARESFRGGNASFQLQIFPFRMTAHNLARHADNPNMSFWRSIKEGYDRFELAGVPSNWDVCEKQYVFGVPGGVALDAGSACPPSTKQKPAGLVAKQAAEDALFTKLVAENTARAARVAEDARKEADAEAAAKARGEAIGNFVGGLIGGKDAAPKVIDPSLVAPVPAPRNRV